MKKFTFFILLFFICFTCDPQCNTCLNNSPYSCLTCTTNPMKNLYINSCQANPSSTLFIAIAIFITILYLIMLGLGHGMYRNIFQNIQLISLISWGYGSQSGIQYLQITNLGFFKNNDFLDSYGSQFFVALMIIAIFIVLVNGVDRLPHNSVATLIKRKRIIFPLRIQLIIYNMTVFSAIAQVTTINVDASVNIVGIIISIIALIKQFHVLIIVFYVSNFTNFQIDDQHYYILIQKISKLRWYTRNNIFIALISKTLIIILFITLYTNTQTAGILITVIMVAYTVFTAITLKYVKIRYFLFNMFANVITCGCLFCMYGCGSASTIGNSQWQQYRVAYYILGLILCCIFVMAYFVQIVANCNQISKQIKSMYLRFIICKKMDDQVELNKYDSDKYREKVTSFRRNLIHNKQIEDRDQDIEREIIV